MKLPPLLRVSLFVAMGLGPFLAPAAQAQDASEVRVVRLSLAEGQVLVSHAGSNVWEEASANLPLQEGDTLATQAGRAEIEFENGATGYLAENSVLQFTQLGFSGGGRATDLTLTQGAGTFYANLTSQNTFRVEARSFNVTIPQRAEFRVDGFLDGAAVQVFLGQVSVSTAKGSTDLEKGQSVAVHDKDFQQFDIGGLPTAEDAFDQWVTEEGEIIRDGNRNTLSYINLPNYYGLSDLSRYGTWVNIAGYGFSWRPFSVGFTWTPYFNGKFILDPNLGWIWVSSEPWGWMPYHFGSWLLSPTLGWVWVPGGPSGLKQWEPSRVNWVQAGNHVGWVAKSPNDREGAPANIAQGIITKSSQPAGNNNPSNEILTGKELRNVSPLKQPPPEIASHPALSAPNQGAHSTIRTVPWTVSNNPSIVYDHGTHTFINRDQGGEQEGNGPPEAGNSAPVAPSGLMPRSGEQSKIPRMTPPSGQIDSRANRVMLPPPYPAVPAPRGNAFTNGILPARPPINAPINPPPPRPVIPPPATPRPIAPAMPSQPITPRQSPAHPDSAARPATRTPQSTTPEASPNRH